MLSISLFGNIIGYTGSILCVIAFFLVQRENVNMIKYNLINLLGSCCLLISLLIHMNIASLSLEIFWMAGSIYGIIVAHKKTKKNKMQKNRN